MIVENNGPLAGVKVVEMGQLIAGPFCGQLLGDMGADVVKLEPPGQGDPMRVWGRGDYPLWWEVVARNKRAVSCNLRGREGQALARRLIAYCPDRQLWPLRERRAIRIFRRKAHIYVSDGAALDDDLRVLAMMQHHGGATRLLDFTKSPFVAAFFALESSTGESVVYALNTPALWTTGPSFDPSLTRAAIDPRIPGHFDRYFIDNRHPLVWFGEPAEMDQRLVAQSGLFVLPGLLDQPLESLLANYEQSGEPLLVRIVLDPGMRQQAIRELYRMNITHATLWPDLDGLARSINQELETVWQPLVDEIQHPLTKE